MEPGVGLIGQRAGDDSIGRMQFQLALRRRGIADPAVLRALDAVPREHFVAPEFEGGAYADRAFPIACGQTISQPFLVAYTTEQLSVRPTDRVLEIGTGSGYQAAILSRVAGEVVTVERYRTLAEAARLRLTTLGYHNIEVSFADGMAGAPDRAPFDRILVTAATDVVPEPLIEQLAEGGIMIVPLGAPSALQRLVKFIKEPGGNIGREELIAVRLAPLVAGKAREL